MQAPAATMIQPTRTGAMQAPIGLSSPKAAPVARGGNLLGWAFAIFNSLRIVAYLPTLWAVGASGQSDQHSLLTWVIFLGSNASMALWLYEQGGQRINRAVLINCVNSVMCLAICLLIGWIRLGQALV